MNLTEHAAQLVNRDALKRDLAEVLNRHSAEIFSNTPDRILAGYLLFSLDAYNAAVAARAAFYGRMDVPGEGSVQLPAADDTKGVP